MDAVSLQVRGPFAGVLPKFSTEINFTTFRSQRQPTCHYNDLVTDNVLAPASAQIATDDFPVPASAQVSLQSFRPRRRSGPSERRVLPAPFLSNPAGGEEFFEAPAVKQQPLQAPLR